MWAALGWGLFAGSSLILGGVLALVLPIRERLLGLIMAFGAGVLISAVAYELVAEAFETSAGNGDIALGLAAGALTFFVGDPLIDRLGGGGPQELARRAAGAGSALAIVLGIVLDGIPESIVIGLGAARGNRGQRRVARRGVPLEPARGDRGHHRPRRRRLDARPDPQPVGRGHARLRARVAARLRASSTPPSPQALAFVLAFAGGAILTMLADTMMPEAFEHGGKLVGLATTLGFGLAFALTILE